MSDFRPTVEQQAALDLFGSGESMVIEALAGTGKTSTLKLLAESTDRRGRYLAFNKAIVNDVKADLPSNFSASTAHSVAFGAVGKRFSHRLQSGRMRSQQIAAILGIDPLALTVGDERKTLSPAYLAGLVMRAVGKFCQTADEAPSRKHTPYVNGIDLPREYGNNRLVGQWIEPAVLAAWRDLQVPSGRLPFKHDHYLKLWQLEHPRLPFDVILFDEAQDANPVMAAVVGEQTHAQRVYVGDSNQAIYEFTGAVNALAEFETDHRSFLTQSFRFGKVIADRANVVLEQLKSPIMLEGFDQLDSTIGPLDGRMPDAILCRTNSGAMNAVLDAAKQGRSCALVGGGTEVASFARGAQDLMQQGFTAHPELACFRSWGEVKSYVAHDEQGGELKLLVTLVEDYTVPVILKALDHMPSEKQADLTVSTAHKSKGRQWPTVQIAGDFAGMDASDAELRLQYVAITRAQQHVDDSGLAAKCDDDTKDGE